MADNQQGNPLDAWVAHIDQTQGQQAPRGRQVSPKPADKTTPQQPPKK